MQELSFFQTAVIAVVEGLTEFLPVSSTGHMVITQSLLGVESTDFVKAFTVIIQLGAILSVAYLYRKRFFGRGSVPPSGHCSPLRRLFLRYGFHYRLFLGFLPAACFGLLCGDSIDRLLERADVVAWVLFVGGIFMLFVDRIFPQYGQKEGLTDGKAFRIGLFQCVAMVPGVSRSMATIVGGMAQRLGRKEATEFSFFLAVPTMFAATAYKLFQLLTKGGFRLIADNAAILLLGNVIAFAVALLAIRFFIRFVSRYGFTAFGWYRIVVGGLLLLLPTAG